MKWFRMYAEARRDPKLLQLSDWQHRIWHEMLCIAAEYDGEIPVADLTRLLRRRRDHLEKAIKELVRLGLFTCGGGLIIPHNWFGRQYKSDSSAERVRRFRIRQSNVTCNVPWRNDVTAPEKKESKKEREREKKWAADLEASLKAEVQSTNVTSLRRLKPLGKWKG
jgi:hypothetical protein